MSRTDVTVGSSAIGGATTQDADDLRFGFGENWGRFLRHLTDERVREAERSMADLLGASDLTGLSLLDIGCGSGLFSLVARRMGARVHSFDYDTDSVACARELRRRFFPADDDWAIEQGSVLDVQYMHELGTFDIVYSWGVLHHTGDMRTALRNAGHAVARGGKLVIAIYNDCGFESRLWWQIKRLYCRSPRALQPLVAALAIAPFEARELMSLTLRGRFREYVHSWTRYEQRRGMSRWHDIIDWVGGFPYEYASTERVLESYPDTEFKPLDVRPTNTTGCNEFVLQKL